VLGLLEVKAIRRAQDHMKSDQRILDDGEFTQSVLDEAKNVYKSVTGFTLMDMTWKR